MGHITTLCEVSGEGYADMNRMRLQRVIWTLLILTMIATACGDDDSAEPAADEPAADEPAADEPAADEPAADEPAADELDREATLRFSTVGGPMRWIQCGARSRRPPIHVCLTSTTAS